MPALETFQWVSRTLSFFNLISMLWLGSTVLLNAERRHAGVWLVGLGMLSGALVFGVQAALIGRDLVQLLASIEFWWRLTWIPFIVSPILWYFVMTWYTGKARMDRHRWLLAAMGLWGAGAIVILLFADLLPALSVLSQSVASADRSLVRLALIVVLYPGFSVLCIALSLLVLRQPAASDRFMGDLGRRRAIPWLVAASTALLVIALAAGTGVTWLLHGLQTQQSTLTARETMSVLLALDVLITGLVAIAVVLMGRAIVSYEIFTGKILPRHGLRRYWRSSLLLAAGYGLAIGGTPDLSIDPVYRVLVATGLMTVFFALLSWQSYVERERSIERLRPFVASAGLYDRLVLPSSQLEIDLREPFRALSEDVLGAERAYLIPTGPLAPLFGAPLACPPDAELPAEPLATLVSRLESSQIVCLPVTPSEFSGAVWAVPLWSERGLNGLLLLGPKRDGSLYTQEEIELARASGERFADLQAGAEIARRLMVLQRQRLAEGQLLDQQTKRTLHDEVLPALHAATLALNGTPDHKQAISLLADAHRRIADLLRELPSVIVPEVARFGLIEALRRELSGHLGRSFDQIIWQIDRSGEQHAASLPPLTAEVMFAAAREVMRNAARYGRGSSTKRQLNLTITITADSEFRVVITDDGIGLAEQGPSASSGHGLALHSTMMAVIGGVLTVDSVPRVYTRVSLTLPASRIDEPQVRYRANT